VGFGSAAAASKAGEGAADDRRHANKAQLFGLHPEVAISAPMSAAYDELPGVSVSRLRALGDITEEMKAATVKFDAVEFTVGLALFRWPNGGSWSFFMCPCGRRARIIRLFEGRLACCRCLKARGLHAHVELVRTERRAAWLTPKRLERLKSDAPARLHPRPGRMLDPGANLEFALRRSRIVARKHGVDRAKDQGL
jgi:hypothetical protein